jgi:D-alanyl-D-alanine carboxypeptidase
MVQRNYNTLIGRYPGADGMKTGFICASGFNLVASATRDGRRLIAVVMGAPSSAARAMKAAQLLERGFNRQSGLSWLMPQLGTVEWLQPVDAAPPNLRDEMCGGHRKRPATEDEDDVAANAGPDSPYAVFLSSLRPPKAKGATLLQEVKMGEPVLVYTGTKPPAPGAQAASESKPAKKKTIAIKPPAAKDGASATAATSTDDGAAVKPKPKKAAAKDTAAVPSSGDGAAAKPKPKKPAPKDAAKDGAAPTAAAPPSGDGPAAKPKPKKPSPKDAAKDGAAPTAAATSSGEGAATKPKPKKPAPKPAPTVITPAVQQTSHAQ